MGYTEEELQKYFAPYLKRAAEVLQLSDSDLLRKLRMHYDGFSFDAKASTHVYAPWSVLNFLSAPGLGFANYCIEAGVNRPYCRNICFTTSLPTPPPTQKKSSFR